MLSLPFFWEILFYFISSDADFIWLVSPDCIKKTEAFCNWYVWLYGFVLFANIDHHIDN
jgi:hypothetical protein